LARVGEGKKSGSASCQPRRNKKYKIHRISNSVDGMRNTFLGSGSHSSANAPCGAGDEGASASLLHAPEDSFPFDPSGEEQEESQVGRLFSNSRIMPPRIAYMKIDVFDRD
jgi:hypothetical protein